MDDFEDAMKSCQFDQLADGGGRIDQLQAGSTVAEFFVQCQQHSEAGAVDETSLGQINACFFMLGFDLLLKAVAPDPCGGGAEFGGSGDLDRVGQCHGLVAGLSLAVGRDDGIFAEEGH